MQIPTFRAGMAAASLGRPENSFQLGANRIWKNSFKKVEIAVQSLGATRADAGIILQLNARTIYAGHVRTPEEPWPHLVYSQGFLGSLLQNSPLAPPLNTIESATLSIKAKRLLYLVGQNSTQFNTAQAAILITAQYLGEGPAYGSHLIYFVVPVQDSRYPSTAAMRPVRETGSTHRLIFPVLGGNVAEQYLRFIQGLQSEITVDILPYIDQAIRMDREGSQQYGIAPRASFGLPVGEDNSNFRITGTSVTLEIPGLYDLGVKFQDLSLKLKLKAYFPFTVENDFQGWTLSNVLLPRVAEGLLRFNVAAGVNPTMISPPIFISADRFKTLRIRMANRNVAPQGPSVLRIFWSRRDAGANGFAQSRSQAIQIGSGGGWNDYRIDLTGNPEWTGLVDKIRIDPVNVGSGMPIGIDEIQFE